MMNNFNKHGSETWDLNQDCLVGEVDNYPLSRRDCESMMLF